jgi:hypothetical protein
VTKRKPRLPPNWRRRPLFDCPACIGRGLIPGHISTACGHDDRRGEAAVRLRSVAAREEPGRLPRQARAARDGVAEGSVMLAEIHIIKIEAEARAARAATPSAVPPAADARSLRARINRLLFASKEEAR